MSDMTETVTMPMWAYEQIMGQLKDIASMGENPKLQGEYRHAKMAGFAQAHAQSILKNLPVAIRLMEIGDEFGSLLSQNWIASLPEQELLSRTGLAALDLLEGRKSWEEIASRKD